MTSSNERCLSPVMTNELKSTGSDITQNGSWAGYRSYESKTLDIYS